MILLLLTLPNNGNWTCFLALIHFTFKAIGNNGDLSEASDKVTITTEFLVRLI
jgi:hypothetical protein